MAQTFPIAAIDDDGWVGYRGSGQAVSYGSPVTLFVVYGDGSIHFTWDENLNQPQASITAEVRDNLGTLVWSESINTTVATNNRSHAEVLAGQTGPFDLTLKIYDGANQTGNLLATGTATDADNSALDYLESSTNILTNIQIGYGDFANSIDPDAVYDTHVWARFENVTVPQGASILGAHLRLQAVTSAGGFSGGGPPWQMFAEATDDATTNPSSRSNYFARTRTSASTSDTQINWFPGSDYTLDATAIIQEIVNRPGWVSGNAIMIFWQHNLFSAPNPVYLNPNYLQATDYPSATGPRLVIAYGIEGVGTASGTGTATGTTQFGVRGTSSSISEAQAFSATAKLSDGTASGTGTATAEGTGAFDSVGSAAGVGNADGAVGGAGSAATGSAAGVGDADGAVGAPEFSGVGTAAGTSTATGDAANTGEAVGTSDGIGAASAVGESTAESVASAVGTGDADGGIGSSEAESTGSAAGVGDADGAVGEQGSAADGSAAGVGDADGGVGAPQFSGVGTAAGTSSASAQRAVLVEVVGTAAGKATAAAGGSVAIFIVGTAAGTSLVEGRKLSETRKFLADLSERLGGRAFGRNGHDSSWFVELDGGVIIEPTAFEPDPATHRNTHYYNALTNTLYRKVITRKEPGVVVAHWQKVSD